MPRPTFAWFSSDTSVAGIAESGTVSSVANGTAVIEARVSANSWVARGSAAMVTGGLTFVSISAGIVHTCSVTTDGSAYCWGPNVVGHLGDGTMTSRLSPVAANIATPVLHVSCGASHTCGLTSGSVAYCWGHDFFGQLGDGQNLRPPSRCW